MYRGGAHTSQGRTQCGGEGHTYYGYMANLLQKEEL